MMLYPAMNDLLKNVPNRYLLVNVVSRRARQIAEKADIEVQGAMQVCAKRPEVVRIFIAPPSWSALEQRLVGRGTDSSEKIQKRLVRAKVELQSACTYDYFVINDSVENAVSEINAIIRAEHCKPEERMALLNT